MTKTSKQILRRCQWLRRRGVIIRPLGWGFSYGSQTINPSGYCPLGAVLLCRRRHINPWVYTYTTPTPELMRQLGVTAQWVAGFVCAVDSFPNTTNIEHLAPSCRDGYQEGAEVARVLWGTP